MKKSIIAILTMALILAGSFVQAADPNPRVFVDGKMYDFVLRSSPTQFILEVNRKLQEGWQLQGGIEVSEGIFYQAIVKQGSAGEVEGFNRSVADSFKAGIHQ